MQTGDLYYGSSKRCPEPPFIGRKLFRRMFQNPNHRIHGSFRAPGNIGILISAKDFRTWLRGSIAKEQYLVRIARRKMTPYQGKGRPRVVDRGRVRALWEAGLSSRDIADYLKVSKSSVGRAIAGLTR